MREEITSAGEASYLEAEEGTDVMIEIASHVREGAKAYLNRQYTTIGIVATDRCDANEHQD